MPSGINRDEVSTRRFPSRSYDFTREEEITGKKQSKKKGVEKKEEKLYI